MRVILKVIIWVSSENVSLILIVPPEDLVHKLKNNLELQ